jgi:hypothetical protein
MNKICHLIILFALLVVTITQETLAQINSKEQNSKHMFDNARKAQKIKLDELKSFTVSFEDLSTTFFGERKIEKSVVSKIDFYLPDKIRRENAGNYSTNQEFSVFTLNGEKISYELDLQKNDGEKINFDPFATYSKDELKSELKRDTFYLLFPITLDSTWYLPLDFIYVGIAESKNERATLLKATSKTGTIYQLFFDEKTNLLLLMSVSWKNKENQTNERKYFYSDYKEMGGLLIATKIKVELNGKVTEERLIKSLKVNPTFKPNFFDVKN